ncbi:MAG: hypothetical protein M5U07_04450 [Xanthobacteraceae bacterium]|nr:hypothetical protein [Xanthobacteraceae bacterium]
MTISELLFAIYALHLEPLWPAGVSVASRTSDRTPIIKIVMAVSWLRGFVHAPSMR